MIRNLAHESRQEIHIHYLDFHMEKSVSTILISPCDSLGIIFITSIKIPKTYMPFVQSPYQDWADLGRLGDWTKGFTVLIQFSFLISMCGRHKLYKGLQLSKSARSNSSSKI